MPPGRSGMLQEKILKLRGSELNTILYILLEMFPQNINNHFGKGQNAKNIKILQRRLLNIILQC